MVKPTRRRSNRRRYALTLPELEHSKAAVLNSLGSLQSRRSYKHAIEEFIRWYCSEPRLALRRLQLNGLVRCDLDKNLVEDTASSTPKNPQTLRGGREAVDSVFWEIASGCRHIVLCGEIQAHAISSDFTGGNKS